MAIRTRKIILPAFLCLLMMLSGFVFLGMELAPAKAEAEEGEAAKPKGERKVKYWKAPMDPTYIRNEPGKSPMGMDMVPVYEDEVSSGATISIDPVTIQNMGVRTAPVTRKDLYRSIRTVGLVVYEEPRQYSVNSKISGWIERLYVNETGVFVKKGEPLLEIYSPELVAAQDEFLLALNNKTALEKSSIPEIAAGAAQLLESSKKRLSYWDISEEQIDSLERTGNVLKTLILYAQYDGIVTVKEVYDGMFVKAGKELFQISDISRVWVFADIYEYELPWVKVGLDAEVILPYAGSDKRLSAKVTYIYPYLEAKTRTVKARLVLDNKDYELKPDMYVNVLIKAQPKQNVLSIPEEAVLYSGEKRTVFIALGGGKFEPRQVQVGLLGETGDVEILQGLSEGDMVVTSAQFMLDSESKLREVVQKMLERQKTQAPQESLDDLF